MMKICTDWLRMPDNFLEFQKLLLLFFPRIVDLKAMMSEHKFPKSGLQELADLMRVPRIGLKHQAGSDAMLTGETFFRFLESTPWQLAVCPSALYAVVSMAVFGVRAKRLLIRELHISAHRLPVIHFDASPSWHISPLLELGFLSGCRQVVDAASTPTERQALYIAYGLSDSKSVGTHTPDDRSSLRTRIR
ncbi:unnamed protein product [Echinostoma caproni]|uniref:poly(A)-specific ribonuclease n=1 Tax=Echinostoma caproni TaxID=27848 RepID=A0A183AD14_9TREM|nr:unnamed protein product [Echinostoma caproni]